MRGAIAFFGQSEMGEIREVRPWVVENFPRMAFTPEEIVAAASDDPDFDGPMDESGIYFLQRGGKVCYVGKANGIISRLLQHRGRPFDAVTMIAGIPPEATGALEMAYIHAWNPPWNHARCYGGFEAGRDLCKRLKAMPLDLVCDQPEVIVSPDELRRAILKLP